MCECYTTEVILRIASEFAARMDPVGKDVDCRRGMSLENVTRVVFGAKTALNC